MQRFWAGVGAACAGLCVAVALSATRQATPAHAQATEFPAGPAKAIVESKCTVCHGADYILTKRASAQEWESTVNTMVSRGADLSDAEIPVVIKYLAASFPEKPAAGAAAPAAPAADKK